MTPVALDLLIRSRVIELRDAALVQVQEAVHLNKAINKLAAASFVPKSGETPAAAPIGKSRHVPISPLPIMVLPSNSNAARRFAQKARALLARVVQENDKGELSPALLVEISDLLKRGES
jgi:hypothetical protein